VTGRPEAYEPRVQDTAGWAFQPLDDLQKESHEPAAARALGGCKRLLDIWTHRRKWESGQSGQVGASGWVRWTGWGPGWVGVLLFHGPGKPTSIADRGNVWPRERQLGCEQPFDHCSATRSCWYVGGKLDLDAMCATSFIVWHCLTQSTQIDPLPVCRCGCDRFERVGILHQPLDRCQVIGGQVWKC
jgi:hypothetical protein